LTINAYYLFPTSSSGTNALLLFAKMHTTSFIMNYKKTILQSYLEFYIDNLKLI